MHMNPPFEYLLANKAKMRRRNASRILAVARRRDLTLKEKKAIFPKSLADLLERTS